VLTYDCVIPCRGLLACALCMPGLRQYAVAPTLIAAVASALEAAHIACCSTIGDPEAWVQETHLLCGCDIMALQSTAGHCW
jgi:hypothetical protein